MEIVDTLRLMCRIMGVHSALYTSPPNRHSLVRLSLSLES